MVLKSLFFGYLLLKWSQSEMPLVLGLSGIFGTFNRVPVRFRTRVPVPGYSFRFQYILPSSYHNSQTHS